MLNEDQKAALMGPLPREVVKQREGAGGVMLDYVSGEYVMRRLLEILGPDGWSTTFLQPPTIRHVREHQDSKGRDVVTITADACVCLMTGGVMRQDVGVAVSTQRSYGEAAEMALKSAATDAFKRAARQLGNAVGLALYDKDQANVSDPVAPSPGKKSPRSPMTDAEKAAKAEDRAQATAAEMAQRISAATSVAELEPLKGEILKLRKTWTEELAKQTAATWKERMAQIMSGGKQQQGAIDHG